MVIEFVTSLCYKSCELAQASLLWGTVAQVSDVAHGPFVILFEWEFWHGIHKNKMSIPVEKGALFYFWSYKVALYSVLEDNYFSWLVNLSQVDVRNLMN